MNTDPTMGEIEQEMARMGERGAWIDRIRYAKDRGARLSAIDGYYRQAWKQIRTVPAHQWALDVYEIDWTTYMTPIELALWGDIRQEGVVLYPQHPVGRFFVDFGHPVARVAIECDGREFHLDRDKDRARQAEIESFGWTVYRLTGRQCNQDSVEVEDPDSGGISIRPGEAQVLIREVAARHGLAANLRRSA